MQMTLFLLVPVSQSNCKGPRQANTLLFFSEQYQRQTLYEDSDGTSLLIAQDGSGVGYGTQKSWGVRAAADVYLVCEQCP